MKKYIYLLLLCGISLQLDAQIGLNFGYHQNISSEWPEMFNEMLETNEDFILKGGYKIGIDYWFKALKNTRLEMMPELSFSRFSSSINDTQISGGEIIPITATILSLEWKTNLYPLDLEGDCNCPTFSKDGDVLQKGLFLQIAPGVNYFINKINSRQLEQNNNSFAFGIGAGIGLDIGFSELLTVTPIVKGYYILGAKWNSDSLETVPQTIVAGNTTNLLQLYAGLRLGLRFDEIRRYR